MQTLNINLPDGIKLSEKDVLIAIATRLYDRANINIEQAASLAGYELCDFIEELMAQSLQERAAATYHY